MYYLIHSKRKLSAFQKCLYKLYDTFGILQDCLTVPELQIHPFSSRALQIDLFFYPFRLHSILHANATELHNYFNTAVLDEK